MPCIDAFPVRRKLPFEGAVLADQRFVEAVADARELQRTLWRNAGASFESKRQAQIDQQQQILVGAG
ncbi:hypothetical protein D3C78_1359200 [compost metagenome]